MSAMIAILLAVSSLAASVAGQSCTTPSGAGVCRTTTDCPSAGGTSVAGYCPGATNYQCCVYSSCSTPSGSGKCMPTAECSGTKVAGYCPGPTTTQCCITSTTTTGSSAKCATAPVASSRAGLVAVAKAIATNARSITYSQAADRWSGISGNVCYPSTPPTADCSAFQTWIYWMCFGKQPDYLNGQSWTAGYTGTLLANGVAVSYASAKPGDLVVYENPSNVAMFIGSGQVVSYGSTGLARILSATYRTITAVRSYPAFGI